jgi:hypothetical protein
MPGRTPKAIKKLKNKKGETIVELLAAILVGTLSVALLAAGIAAAGHIESQADQSDTEFYEALSEAEAKTTPSISGAVATVREGARTVSIPIDVYGSDGVWSYRASQSESGVGE